MYNVRSKVAIGHTPTSMGGATCIYMYLQPIYNYYLKPFASPSNNSFPVFTCVKLTLLCSNLLVDLPIAPNRFPAEC